MRDEVDRRLYFEDVMPLTTADKEALQSLRNDIQSRINLEEPEEIKQLRYEYQELALDIQKNYLLYIQEGKFDQLVQSLARALRIEVESTGDIPNTSEDFSDGRFSDVTYATFLQQGGVDLEQHYHITPDQAEALFEAMKVKILGADKYEQVAASMVLL